jgi:Tol biopolymer transport system component
VFAARSGDETNLWRIRLSPAGLAVGNPERITLGAGLEMQPSASKSGRLVFTTAVPNGDIFAMPLDAETGISKGSMYAIAPSPGFDGWPSITRDGKRLAFASRRLGKLGLFVYEIETSRVSAFPAGENLRAWSEISADGKSIVYHTATTPDGKYGSDAWERAIAGGPPRQLCKQCFFMSRTRDQQTILLTNLNDPIRIIRRNTLNGSESVYIHHPKWGVLQPNLSPDERWIAFYVRISPDRARIYLAPWDLRATVPESEWIAVTDGTSDDTTPVWSPGGRILYFASDRDGVTCIYGQRVSATTGMEGPPFSVRHLHAAGERAANAGVAHRGFGVAKDKLVLTVNRRSGNIWLLE